VPQLAHLKSTSSAGDPIVAHCVPLTMKDTEPQLWQSNPFCSITSCRHRARSPEIYIPHGTPPRILSSMLEGTSENPQKAKFAELEFCELRRIPIPRTSVNKGEMKRKNRGVI
jgi:hypothetical protein